MAECPGRQGERECDRGSGHSLCQLVSLVGRKQPESPGSIGLLEVYLAKGPRTRAPCEGRNAIARLHSVKECVTQLAVKENLAGVDPRALIGAGDAEVQASCACLRENIARKQAPRVGGG